jgi:hypothetical protein
MLLLGVVNGHSAAVEILFRLRVNKTVVLSTLSWVTIIILFSGCSLFENFSFLPHVHNYLWNLLMDLSSRIQLRSNSFSSNQLRITRHLYKAFLSGAEKYSCKIDSRIPVSKVTDLTCVPCENNGWSTWVEPAICKYFQNRYNNMWFEALKWCKFKLQFTDWYHLIVCVM